MNDFPRYPQTEARDLDLARARARAAKENTTIRAIRHDHLATYYDFGSSKDAEQTWTVTRPASGPLTCNCPARVTCKHIGAVSQRIIDDAQARLAEFVQGEASRAMAVMLRPTDGMGPFLYRRV